MRIIVTGKSGQIVTALRRKAERDLIVPIGRPEFDLQYPQDALTLLSSLQPDALISAAAFTAVDRAENETRAALAINAEAPGHLAAAAAELGVPIVHISTDYIFDGRKLAPYVETDLSSPMSVYGVTKLAGERAVAAANRNHAILRTAWVYSPYGNNFLKTMLRLAAERQVIRVVNDQIGNPTSALDIADGLLRVVHNLVSNPHDAKMRGIFHMTASGQASWADFAREIMATSAALGGAYAQIVPISSEEYPTPALRPANSCLDSARLSQVHQVSLPNWRASARAVVAELICRAEATDQYGSREG